MDEDAAFLPNGTVKLTLVGRIITLRRPNLGEFRHLQEGFDELVDDSTDALMRVREMSESLDDLSAEQQKARTGEVRAMRRELTSDVQGKRLAWLAEVVKTLGDGELDPDDPELPSWVLDASLPTDLTRHWQNRPGPPSGVR